MRSESNNMPGIIFLTGHRKSGTTMFHKLFDGHPELTMYPVDLALLYAYFPCFVAKDHTRDELKKRLELVLRKSLGGFVNDYGVDNNSFDLEGFLDTYWNELQGKDLRSKQVVLNGLVKAWYQVTGSDVSKDFVCKETSQAIHFDEINGAIGPCKFINLIRDPRDNYGALKAGVGNYYSKMGEGELETLASLINRARMDLLIAHRHSQDNADRFYSVRFEDITSAPEREMKKVAEFAGIDFHECLLHPTVFGKQFDGNSHEGKKFSSISNDHVGKWKDRISDFEAQVIEFWVGDAMEEWGYERYYTHSQCSESFGEFYKWYNCKYFHYDSFSAK